MKNFYRLTFLFLLIALGLQAQSPDFSLVGFATQNGGTTGGEGGTVVNVSNYADLKKYAETKDTKYIINVSGTIANGADGGSIKIASNKTILGTGSTTLMNGVGFTISGNKNIIIKNIKITMMGVTTRTDKSGVYSSTGDEGRPQILTNSGDCISISGTSTNIWVDHCEFYAEDPRVQTNQDLYDGLLDVKNASGYITISWCYFHDHHKCHLIGSSDTDLSDDRKITFHHNYYKTIQERVPLYRGGVGHFFNNYNYDVYSGSVNSRVNACIKVEKNYFEKCKNTVYSKNSSIVGKAERVDNLEVNCTKSEDYPGVCAPDIPYSYSKVLTSDVSTVKTVVTSYAGVGKLDAVSCNASITASGATTFCQGGSVVLTASSGSSYVWKNGTTQVATTATYTATSAGSYTVEVTNSAACKATSSATVVTVNSLSYWYADTDGDGKGDPSTKQSACAQPSGYVTDNTDQCPSDKNKITPGNCGCGKTEESCLDCNGTVNGKATLDNCGRCIGGTTGKTACVSALEAEAEACGFQGILESKNAGFIGNSYINVDNVIGSFINFGIDASAAGEAVVSFRYANGGANDRPATVKLNGVDLSNSLSFPSTGAFTVWKTVDLKVTLVKGRNNLQLRSTSSEGLANIDQLGLVSSGISSSCEEVVTGNVSSAGSQIISVHPNPFMTDIQISVAGEFEYYIYNVLGEEIESGKGKQFVKLGSELPTGVYIMKIKAANSEYNTRIQKQ